MRSKILLAFVFFWAMIYNRDLSTYSSSNVFCNSCINSNNGSYWCSFSAYTEWGYCCESSESRSGCIGSGYYNYECSTDSLPTRAEYLLCPVETSQCQSTADFHVTSSDQSRRINTGTPGTGRTCEYLISVFDPATNVTYDTSTHDVTINVEYIHSNTYLGVYSYDVDAHTTRLIRELGAGNSGSIQVSVNRDIEAYVQMLPNSSSSYAIFTISKGGSDDSGLSGGAIAAIVIVIIVILIIAGLIAAYVIYVKYYKNKKKSNASNRSPETQSQMPRENENAYYIKNNPEVAYQSSYQGPKQGGAPSNYNGNTNGNVQNTGVRSNNYRLNQQQTAARM